MVNTKRNAPIVLLILLNDCALDQNAPPDLHAVNGASQIFEKDAGGSVAQILIEGKSPRMPHYDFSPPFSHL